MAEHGVNAIEYLVQNPLVINVPDFSNVPQYLEEAQKSLRERGKE